MSSESTRKLSSTECRTSTGGRSGKSWEFAGLETDCRMLTVHGLHGYGGNPQESILELPTSPSKIQDDNKPRLACIMTIDKYANAAPWLELLEGRVVPLTHSSMLAGHPYFNQYSGKHCQLTCCFRTQGCSTRTSSKTWARCPLWHLSPLHDPCVVCCWCFCAWGVTQMGT